MPNHVDDYFQQDFSSTDHRDIRANLKQLIESMSFHALFQGLLTKIIPFFQLYYVDESCSFQEYSFIYLTIQTLLFFTNYYIDVVSSYFNDLFMKKDYYLLGSEVRKTCLFLLISNILIYILTVLICYNDQYLTKIVNWSFFTLTIYSLNSTLNMMVHTFDKIGISSIYVATKFITNGVMCKYLNRKSHDTVQIVCLSNSISEIVAFASITIAISVTNPYPQSWIKPNGEDFEIKTCLNYLSFSKLIRFVYLRYLFLFIILFYILAGSNKGDSLMFIFLIMELTVGSFCFNIKKQVPLSGRSTRLLVTPNLHTASSLKQDFHRCATIDTFISICIFIIVYFSKYSTQLHLVIVAFLLALPNDIAKLFVDYSLNLGHNYIGLLTSIALAISIFVFLVFIWLFGVITINILGITSGYFFVCYKLNEFISKHNFQLDPIINNNTIILKTLK